MMTHGCLTISNLELSRFFFAKFIGKIKGICIMSYLLLKKKCFTSFFNLLFGRITYNRTNVFIQHTIVEDSRETTQSANSN